MKRLFAKSAAPVTLPGMIVCHGEKPRIPTARFINGGWCELVRVGYQNGTLQLTYVPA